MKNVKQDFPILTNNKNLVYIDSAATSQKPRSVLDAVIMYYQTHNANIHRGIYPLAEQATKSVEEVRNKVTRYINANKNEEIIFTKGTTESINTIAYAWGENNIAEGDTLVVTVSEHHANFVPWQQLAKRKRANFTVVDVTDEGKLDEDDVLKETKNAKLFAFSSVSNVIGSETPAKQLIQKIRKQNPGILIVVDAAQEIPHKKVDVQDMDCDFLVFSGHKMLAETGVGILYGKYSLLERMQPFLFGGSMVRDVGIDTTTFADPPYKFEAGTVNISGVISLGAAIDYLENVGLENVYTHTTRLAQYCRDRVGEIRGVTVLGSPESKSGIVSFVLNNIHPHDVAQVLADKGVCVRAGHHCAMPLHKRLGIPASVRASFYLYNNDSDVDALVSGVKDTIKVFR